MDPIVPSTIRGLTRNLYVEIFKKSYLTSTYIRVLLLTLVMTSLIFFCALLNCWKYSWMNARITMHQHALEYFSEAGSRMANRDKVEAFVETKGYRTRAQVQEILTEYEKMRVANVLNQRLPIIGIAFDVNDLGLVSGITITLIYFAFVYCITLRYTHLFATFQAVQTLDDPKDRKTAKILISMDQILTIHKSKRKNFLRVLGEVPKYLYTVPVIIYILILANDFSTYEVAAKALDSANRAAVQSVLCIILLVVMILLMVRAFQIASKTDALWAVNYPEDQVDEGGI